MGKNLYKITLILFSFFLSFFSLVTVASIPQNSTDDEHDTLSLYRIKDSIESSFRWQSGEIEIGEGLATLHLGPAFKYLNPKQSEYVLFDLWNNPRQSGCLGMIFPAQGSPLSEDPKGYAIEISFSEEGYIKDDDAKEIDYAELLESMQKDTREANEQRVKDGYPAMELEGWASPPFYDEQSKKLHWAKKLRFEGYEGHTLNYNIRVLGRRGVLVLNVIADMKGLATVQKDLNALLAAVDFKEGERYSDFNPDVDKVAAYGIAGLIAGKVLAKAGLFALLAKFWKLIVLALLAAGAAIRQFVTGKKNLPAAGTNEEEEKKNESGPG